MTACIDRLIKNEETKSLSLYITEMIAELEDKLFLELKCDYSEFINFRKNCRWIIGEAVWNMMKEEPVYYIHCYDLINQTIDGIPCIIQTDVRKMNPFKIRLEYEKKDPVPQFRYDLCCTSDNILGKVKKIIDDGGMKFTAEIDPDAFRRDIFDYFRLQTDFMEGWKPMLNDRKIKRVIFNDPCTIILWNDGTKTIVRVDNEPYDPEKGLAMCLAKKALGNKGNYYDIFRKYLPKEEKEEVNK